MAMARGNSKVAEEFRGLFLFSTVCFIVNLLKQQYNTATL